MNAKKFSEALGNVREEYITEAIAYQPKRHRRRWAAWGCSGSVRLFPRCGNDSLPFLDLCRLLCRGLC